MKRLKIEEKVLEIILDMDFEEPIDRETILSADYVEEEIFNSISFVLLIVLLEDEFGIEIDSEQLLIENLSSFDKIIDLVQSVLDEEDND